MGTVIVIEIAENRIVLLSSEPKRDTELLDIGNPAFWCPYDEEWLKQCATDCERGWFCPLHLPDEWE